MKQYWYIENGQQAGPVPANQLKAKGVLADTFVWTEGMADWQKAGDVADLASLFQAAPTPPSAPAANTPPPQAPTTGTAPKTSTSTQQTEQQKYYQGEQSGSTATMHSFKLDGVPTIDQIQSKYNVFSIFYWLTIGLFIPVMIGMVIIEDSFRRDEEGFYMFVLGTIYAGIWIVSLVLRLQLLYYAWKSIDDGITRTTPGQAVGFLFIPLFTFYWDFQAYKGFFEDAKKYLQTYDLKETKFDMDLPAAQSILKCCQIVPYLGFIAYLANLIIRFLVVQQYKNVMIHIVTEKQLRMDISGVTDPSQQA